MSLYLTLFISIFKHPFDTLLFDIDFHSKYLTCFLIHTVFFVNYLFTEKIKNVNITEQCELDIFSPQCTHFKSTKF